LRKRRAAARARVNVALGSTELSMWKRAFGAFLILVAAVGILSVADMILRMGIGDFIYSFKFAVPAYALAFFLAPTVMRVLPLRRNPKRNGHV
jgi:hypothetical protein